MTMLVLGIDTATAVGSLAVVRDGAVLGTETIVEDAAHASVGRASGEHSAELGPALDRLLERCGVVLGDLDGLGIGLGPGSYTGLRVGVAFAKGLEFGLRVPLVGVPSFEATAYACRKAERAQGATVCALVDAKMGGIYAGLYRVRGDEVQVVREPWVSAQGEFVLSVEGPVLFAGPDEAVMGKLGEAFREAEFQQAFPDAAYTALRAAEVLATLEKPARFATIEPYYLRPSFAELADQRKEKK
jgi:tRNA threonylcarbamoyladenosine biosynthesis protein TsaB